VAYAALFTAAHLQQQFRQLRRLAGSGLAADNDRRVPLDRGPDLVAARVDRQRGIEADAAQASMRST
jgi:hypothetical protein